MSYRVKRRKCKSNLDGFCYNLFVVALLRESKEEIFARLSKKRIMPISE